MHDHVKLACLADLHGRIPGVVIDADLIIIAGDICPDGTLTRQLCWTEYKFLPWLRTLPPTIFIPGNHDALFTHPELLPDFTPHHLLIDSRKNINVKNTAISTFGSPWAPPFYNWSFMADEKDIARRLRGGEGCDILITHGPPWGIADRAMNYNTLKTEHAGSFAVRDFIIAHKPALVVCGHLHANRGIHQFHDTVIINAAMHTDEMKPWSEPIYYNLIIDKSDNGGRFAALTAKES